MPDKKPKKRRIRTAVGTTMAKFPAVRRWQIRRLLKYIDKSKEKGRRLPAEYAEMGRFLSKVPKAQRAAALEKAMEANQQGAIPSRDYRRAAAAQQRRSGQGGARYRPGMPPGTIQQSRQQAKQQTRRKRP
jgi:hypothetical protein